MASLMPISRVRSVTDTSMMFMMPMPPTSSDTAATAPRSPVRIVVVEAMVARICVRSRMVKSSSSPGTMRRRSRSTSSASRCTRGMSAASVTEIEIVPILVLPAMRR